MSYTITRTNGLNPIVIPDGTINTSTTVTLVGKNYPNYGAILDQNFIRLLENSASPDKPSAPIVGQIWWDSGNKTLKVNIDGGTGNASWKNVGSTTSGATKPAGPNNVGDLWWDTTNGQLWAYDGSILDFKLIGPIGGAAGIASETITDSIGGTHDVISFNIGGSRYTILSADAQFIPNPPIPGFQTINPGLNLASQAFLTNAKFVGQASDTVTLTGISASSFMRTDLNTNTTGTINVLNNNGLYVGAASNFHVSVTAPNVAVINETNGGAMNFKVRNSGGTQLDAMDIYPNGNVVANYDFTVAGNISFANSANDLVITGTSPSYNQATGALRLSQGGMGIAGNINTGGSQNYFVGNVTAANINSNAVIAGTTVVATGNLYGTIATASQPYITSLGTLPSLTVTGLIGSGTSTYTGLLTVNAQPYITSVGTLTGLTVSGTTSLGANTNVKITGGTAGQYMITDGAGNLSWTSITGTTNQIAYFSSGTLAGSSGFTWNGSTLYVDSAINATGDITAFYSSDERLKTDIEPINNALAKVSTLRGVTFSWNDLGLSTFDPEMPRTARESGVIAQEVQAVLPEVVTERENGYLAVNYEKIVPLLIEAIKELKAEIDILKSK